MEIEFIRWIAGNGSNSTRAKSPLSPSLAHDFSHSNLYTSLLHSSIPSLLSSSLHQRSLSTSLDFPRSFRRRRRTDF